MPLLEGKGVTEYFGGLAAVSNMDFHGEQGKTLGPNGAGKTTLFHVLSAVLVPKSGEIRFKGQNSTGLSPYTICRIGVARTFQLVKVLPDLPAREEFVQKSTD
jgi:ABC-type branched-subunit amino acid transport system ATPase component